MSDLSLLLSATIIATFPQDMKVSEAADWRMLQCIALVESGADPLAVGDQSRAKGAWQMHVGAWFDANVWLRQNGRKTWSRVQWKTPDAQREIAYAYLQVCKKRLIEANQPVNPRTIALTWNMGFAGFQSYETKNIVNTNREDYAQRVSNIFFHAE